MRSKRSDCVGNFGVDADAVKLATLYASLRVLIECTRMTMGSLFSVSESDEMAVMMY
jgi:hypothetical protein